jgi:hypothetical protein
VLRTPDSGAKGRQQASSYTEHLHPAETPLDAQGAIIEAIKPFAKECNEGPAIRRAAQGTEGWKTRLQVIPATTNPIQGDIESKWSNPSHEEIESKWEFVAQRLLKFAYHL